MSVGVLAGALTGAGIAALFAMARRTPLIRIIALGALVGGALGWVKRPHGATQNDSARQHKNNFSPTPPPTSSGAEPRR